MRCGRPRATRHSVALRWQPKGRSRGVVGAIDVIARTRTFRLEVPRCQACEPAVSARTLSTVLGIVGAVLLAGSLVWVCVNQVAAMFVTMGVAGVVLAGAVVAATWRHEARVIRAAGSYVWLAGFSPEFLAKLPPYQPAADQPEAQPSGREQIRQAGRQLRPLLWLVALALTGFGGFFFYLGLPILRVRNAPIVAGKVVMRQVEGTVVRFTIENPDGTRVHMRTGEHLANQIPATVKYRYAGVPGVDVFLYEYQPNPVYLAIPFVGIGVLTALGLLATRSR